VPLPHSPPWILFHSWPAEFDRSIFRDIAVNFVIFIPAGITGHLAFRRRGNRLLALAAPVGISALLSATIEMVQLWVPSRDTNLLDLLVNVAGAITGVILAIALEEAFPAVHASSSRKPADRAALVLLGCAALWLLFPLMPIMGRTTLRHKLAIFGRADMFDLVTILSFALVWFALGELLQAAGLRPMRKLILFSILVVPARFFITGQRPLPAEIVGAALGALAYLWLRIRSRWILAAAFLGAIVIRGLTPFVLLRRSLPFSWVPFTSFLEMEWQQGTVIAAEKFFWYGTAIWLLRRARVPKLASAAVLAAILLAIEIAQTRIPGHVPELTDPLLGIAAAWSVFVLADR
jgi:glycopeptide antibiotics resistance protein